MFLEKFLRCFLLLELRVSLTIAVEIEEKFCVIESENLYKFTVDVLNSVGHKNIGYSIDYSTKSKPLRSNWIEYKNGKQRVRGGRTFSLCLWPFCLTVCKGYNIFFFYVQFDPLCYKVVVFGNDRVVTEEDLRFHGRQISKAELLREITKSITNA